MTEPATRAELLDKITGLRIRLAASACHGCRAHFRAEIRQLEQLAGIPTLEQVL